jgi:glycosyltransferase involved in cell wall biosynthesis
MFDGHPGGAAPALSIIVPVYNTAPYLRQCLESLEAQTLPRDSFEVLLIDDGSTDASPDICREYTARNQHFRLLALEKNSPGGCGVPSNLGIRAARGRYIGFVDSDDFAAPEMFATLLETAQRHDADITLCDQYRLDTPSGRVLDGPDTNKFKRLTSANFSELTDVEQKRMYLSLDTPPWLKVFKTEFLQRHNLCFPEGAFFYEDVPFHWETMLLAKTIAHVNKKLITHRLCRSGQTVYYSGAAVLGIIPHLERIQDFLMRQGCFAHYHFTFMRFAAGRYAWALPQLDRELRREFLRQAGTLHLPFSPGNIRNYCQENKVRLRTGVKHYFLLRGKCFTARYAALLIGMGASAYRMMRKTP